MYDRQSSKATRRRPRESYNRLEKAMPRAMLKFTALSAYGKGMNANMAAQADNVFQNSGFTHERIPPRITVVVTLAEFYKNRFF